MLQVSCRDANLRKREEEKSYVLENVEPAGEKIDTEGHADSFSPTHTTHTVCGERRSRLLLIRPRVRRSLLESREAALKDEADRIGGAVSLFGDN